ncbi:MAG TPA: Zn-dependent exopeptidase M28 [Chloroflexi bacterium]|nr:Zn-dependent exopeptidase M28 [Chloroflexota bacterium]
MRRSSPNKQPRHLGWRLLTLFLILSLLPVMGSAVTHGQSDAPLDVPFGPVLYLIRTTGDLPGDLPPTTVVHARLDEPDAAYWVASGATGDAAGLAALGLTVSILDDDTTDAIYYVADATSDNAVVLARAVSTILWQGAMHLLLTTDAAHELAVVETLPAQGVSLSLLAALPLTVENASAANVWPAAVRSVDPQIAALLQQITPQEIQSLVNQLSGQTPVTVGGAAVTLNTRYTFASRLRSAEQFIYEYYQRLGLNVRYASWNYGQYSGRNVVAEVRGTTQPTQVLLVGGHLDDNSNAPYTNAPGADDNATGTAATLVLARLLAQYPPGLTVRFIHFTGEEQGQWGSKVYASALRQAGEQVVGFFNLDMIGWDGNGDRVVEIHTASGPKSNALADQYLERNDRYGIGLTFERKTTTASRFSDHSPFWDNDYASFLVIENFFDDAPRPRDRNPYYHNTGDLASRVDYDYVARIARVTLAAFAELAGYRFSGVPVTPTPTATATPTATPTATATPGGGVCSELVTNGDFEVSSSWQFGSTPYPGRYTTTTAFSGARAVQLGIPTGVANRRAYSTVFQRVTIPANAEAPVLLRYVERTHGAADNADYRETALLNSSYGYITRLARSTAAGSDSWQERVFDVTAYRGRTLVIYFNVYNDGAGTQMWSYLDRVELGSCVGASSPEEPALTATPTPTVTPTLTATPEITSTPEITATPAITVTPVVTLTPALTFAPAQLYLGEMFSRDAITVAVQLGTERSGFTWEAQTDASWLSLTPFESSEGAALHVSVHGEELTDGVYTATIRASLGATPEIVTAAPVIYVRGAAQWLYLPTVLSEPPSE